MLLLKVFLRKIRQVSRAIGTINNKKKFSKDQLKLIATMAKLTCLMSTALMTSLISIILIVCTAISPDLFYIGIASMFSSSIDVIVNALCLLLHWPFAESIYQKLCKPCHYLMIRKCTSNVEHYIINKQKSSSKQVMESTDHSKQINSVGDEPTDGTYLETQRSISSV